MPHVAKRPPSVAIWLIVVVVGLAGCREGRTFTPVDPSMVPERITKALDDDPYTSSQAVPAGRAGSDFFSIGFYPGENPSAVYLLDWTSAANSVTIALHRTGEPLPRTDGQFFLAPICSVPARLQAGGTAIGAALPLPLCPVALSNTSSDKPKLLEIKDLPPGEYTMVVTNRGPGNETIRSAILGN